MEDELLTPPAPTFFRFPDEARGIAALDAAGLPFTYEDGNKCRIAYWDQRLPNDTLEAITQ